MSEYIEREALLKDISELETAGAFTASFKNAVLKIISEKPTVDVEEVRRGKWIEREHWIPLARDCAPFDYDNYDKETHSEKMKYWHCSQCDYEASRSIEPFYNYCPYCGAKMDLGDDVI